MPTISRPVFTSQFTDHYRVIPGTTKVSGQAGPSRFPQYSQKDFDAFRGTHEFLQRQSKYLEQINNLFVFAVTQGKNIRPRLSQEKLTEIGGKLALLHRRLLQREFGEQERVLYSGGDALLGMLEDLLKNSAINLQRRINAVLEVSETADRCAESILSVLDKTVADLQASTRGIKAAAYRAKVKMMEQLISDYVLNNLPVAGDKIDDGAYYVDSLFNGMAKTMGVTERRLRSIPTLEADITPQKRKDCSEGVFKKLNPTALASMMADVCLDRMNALPGFCAGNSLSADGSAIGDVAELAENDLKNEYGKVVYNRYISADYNPRFSGVYQCKRNSDLIARDLFRNMRVAGVVSHDIPVVLSAVNNFDTLSLGDIVWRERSGVHHDFEFGDIVCRSPKEILANIKAQCSSPKDVIFSLDGLLQRLRQAVVVEGIEEIPPAWQFLLNLEGSIEGDCARSTTALHFAAYCNDLDVLALLVDAGVEVGARDRQGKTALRLALENGHEDALKFLLSQVPVQQHRELAQAVIEDNRSDELRCLVNVGFDSSFEPGGVSLVMWTAQQRKPEMLRLLVRTAGQHGLVRALNWAASQDDSGPLETLIAAGVSLERRSNKGHTPLMHAVLEGRLDAVKRLLDAGADIEAKDSDGYTPLMGAAYFKHAQVLQLLVDRGADLSSAGHVRLGTSPLEIVQILLDADLRHRANEDLRQYLLPNSGDESLPTWPRLK
jgi:ankyrin repeat protein